MRNRRPGNDPRTVARDIPGIFDTLFPQLAPGVVAYLNRGAFSIDQCEPVDASLISESKLQPAMLFEVAVAAGEQLIQGGPSIDWEESLSIAVLRQRRHFDAKLPEGLTEVDKRVAQHVAENLVRGVNKFGGHSSEGELLKAPTIPGYQWIATGVGDFSVGRRLIEVKCTNANFSSSDYRQIVMYWLLSYASAVEGRGEEWTSGVLLNPRLNTAVVFKFDDVIGIIGAGRSKVDILELFSSLVADRAERLLTPVH